MVYDHLQTHNILTLNAIDSNIRLQDSNSLTVPTQPVVGISMNHLQILATIPPYEKASLHRFSMTHHLKLAINHVHTESSKHPTGDLHANG